MAEGEVAPRNPIRGTFVGCCASALAPHTVSATTITKKPHHFSSARPLLDCRDPCRGPTCGRPFSNGRTPLDSAQRRRRSAPIIANCLLHRITVFARASTLGGMVNPICFAAFRLMTNSNFVGCSTGRSAGLAPLRILSTYVAARRYKSIIAHAVARNPPGLCIFGKGVYRQETAFYREVRNLFSVRIEDGAIQHKDCTSTPLDWRLGMRSSISLKSTTARYWSFTSSAFAAD